MQHTVDVATGNPCQNCSATGAYRANSPADPAADTKTRPRSRSSHFERHTLEEQKTKKAEQLAIRARRQCHWPQQPCSAHCKAHCRSIAPPDGGGGALQVLDGGADARTRRDLDAHVQERHLRAAETREQHHLPEQGATRWLRSGIVDHPLAMHSAG